MLARNTSTSAAASSHSKVDHDNGDHDSHPSSFWKAYAEGLKPFLTSEVDLSARDMALYITSPYTFGIAGGDNVPVEIRNQQIINHCDRVLDLKSPLLDSFGSYPSYFDTQFKILSQGGDVTQSKASLAKLAGAREEIHRCQQATLEAYKTEASRYSDLHQLDPSINFAAWMKQYGFAARTMRQNL